MKNNFWAEAIQGALLVLALEAIILVIINLAG